MREIRVDEYGEVDVTYDELVREAVGDWWNQAAFGYYQGDFLYVFRDGERVGYLVVGYGSCSGCDWLQGVVDYQIWERMSEEKRDKLRNDLDGMVEQFRNNVRWFESDQALVDSIWDDEGGNYWFYNEPDFRSAMARVLAGEEVVKE